MVSEFGSCSDGFVEPIPTDLVNADLAVARYGEAGRVWLEQMWLGDPLADAVAGDTHPGGTSTSLLRTALERGIDALDDPTESMRDLFAFLDDEPEWGDHDRMGRAADALIVNTAPLGIVLGAASLVRGRVTRSPPSRSPSPGDTCRNRRFVRSRSANG